MLTQAEIQNYHETGLLIKQNFAQEKMVAEINSNGTEVLKIGIEGLVYEKHGKTPCAIQDAHLYNSYFEKVIRHPLLLDNVREILQSDWRLRK